MKEKQNIQQPAQAQLGRKKIRSTWNYRLTEKDMHATTGKSLTLEDTNWSIQEIVQRFTIDQGVSLGLKQADYGDAEDEDFDDIDREKIMLADVNTKFRVNREHAERVQAVKEASKKAKEAKNKPLEPPKEEKGS